MSQMYKKLFDLKKLYGFGIILPLFGSLISVIFLKEWRFAHTEWHALIEALGGVCAVFIFLLIIHVRSYALKFTTAELVWIISALFSMGCLDILHAVSLPGNNFVWFHSVATFLGGCFFAGMWLSRKTSGYRLYCVIFAAVITTAFVTLWSYKFPDFVPDMFLFEGYFSVTARMLNIIGGLGFLAGFGYFVRGYYTKSHSRDYLYFASHCLLFGMAGVLFELSVIWDAAWWWWHVLRFLAYAILVVFLLNIYRQYQGREQLQLATQTSYYSVLACSSVVLIIGLMVIIGWHIKHDTLIQVLPNFAPMQYNTALCFVLSAVGVLFACFSHGAVRFCFGAVVSLIGLLTLLQYVSGFDFKIDQALMEYTVMTRVSHPGRMAPNTAICFSLSGFTLMLFGMRRSLVLGCAISIMCLACLSLLGYAGDEESLYGWGNLTRMAIHTACCFVLLSLSFIILCLFYRGRNLDDLWKMAPLSISLVFAILFFFGWYVLSEEARARNRDYMQTLINDTQAVLVERYELYEGALRGGVGLFNAVDDVSYDTWKDYIDTLNISETLPGINGIGYIHSLTADQVDSYVDDLKKMKMPEFKVHPETFYPDKFIIQYIEPYNKNVEALGLDIGFEANRRTAAERSRDLGVAALTKKILLVQDHKRQAGFLLLMPVYETKDIPKTLHDRRLKFRGWVYAPFIGPNFFKDIEKFNQNQLSLEVYDGRKITESALIYSDFSRSDYREDTLFEDHNQGVIRTLKIAGRVWTLHWRPNENYAAPANERMAVVLLIFGLVFSAFVYVTLSKMLQSKELVRQKVIDKTRELKDAIDFQHLISNTIPDFIFIKDKEFRIVEANQAFLNLYPDHEEQSIIGRTTFESYKEADVDEFLRDDRLAFETGYVENEETISFPDGSVLTLFTKKVRFEDHKGEQYILAIARDISQAKIAQEKIVQANAELERSNQELARFAYIASHDLQEPLRKISGFTGRLQKHLDSVLENDDEAKLYMKFIIDGASRMRGLVHGLLEYSSVTTSKAHFEKLETNDSLDIALDNLSEMISETNASVTSDRLAVVKYDKMLLAQIFQNLISNAIKYKSEESPVIHISSKKRNKFIEFSVQDNGLGIKDQYLTHIFEMFKRLHRKDQITGTGIGLSLCQKIVERYGGKIWVESEFGKGSIFYFTIPIT